MNAQFEHSDLLIVSAWGQRVGVLASSGRSGGHLFQYDPSWSARAIELAPLTVPNRGPAITSWPKSGQSDCFYGLPPFISDSLPDRYGDEVLDKYLAHRGLTRDNLTALDRLTYIGDRGMGALVFHPAQPFTGDANPITLAELVTASREVLSGSAVNAATGDIFSQLLRISGSTGGAQAKALVSYRKTTDRGIELRIGSESTPVGFSPAILKLTTDNTGTIKQPGRVELAYARMATEAGIEMESSYPVEQDEVTHFLTRRFDRTHAGGRIHFQTLAALIGLNFNDPRGHEYTVYLNAVQQLKLSSRQRQQAFRRIAFNVAAAARDDHLKNLGFLCDQNGQWRLAPAYDITFTPKTGTIHQMHVLGKAHDITPEDLLGLAEIHGIQDAKTILQEAAAAVRRWPAFAALAQVPAADSALVAKAFPKSFQGKY